MLHSARPPSPSLVSPPGLPPIIARRNYGKQRVRSFNKNRTFVHEKDRVSQGVDIRNAREVEGTEGGARPCNWGRADSPRSPVVNNISVGGSR